MIHCTVRVCTVQLHKGRHMPAVHCAKNNLRIEEAEHITAGVDATVYVWLLCTHVLQQNIWHSNQIYCLLLYCICSDRARFSLIAKSRIVFGTVNSVQLYQPLEDKILLICVQIFQLVWKTCVMFVALCLCANYKSAQVNS